MGTGCQKKINNFVYEYAMLICRNIRLSLQGQIWNLGF